MEVMRMTTLVRWDPAVELDSLQSEMNRLFDGFFGHGRAANGGTPPRWIPAMDLAEEGDDLVLTADLPGLSEDDVSIEVKDGVLTVSGERRTDRDHEGRGYRRVERSFGRFSRSLSLPDGIEADEIAANFDRGVLEIRIPKPEQRQPQRIPIGTGSSRTIEAEASQN
jgi:HSP20 family protein